MNEQEKTKMNNKRNPLNSDSSFVQSQDQNQKKKHPILLILLIIIVVFAGIGGCISCSGYNTARKISDTINQTFAETSFDNTAVAATVIYAKDGLRIVYNGMVGEVLDADLKLLIENNSSEKITIQANNITIDGFTVSTYFYSSLSGGQKTNDHLSVLHSSLKDNGLSIKTMQNAKLELTITKESDRFKSTKETVSFSLR